MEFTFLNASPVPMVLYKDKIIYDPAIMPMEQSSIFSPIVENILGYKPEEFMEIFIANPPKTRSIINLVDHKVMNLKKGEIYTFSYEMQKKNGDYIFLESTVKAFYDQEENKIAGFIAVSRDITEKLFEEKLQRTNEFLKHLSTMDGLTGIANRRRFDEFIETECHRAIESGLPISLVMFDIDFFKLYNDTYGHQAGDDCLTVSNFACALLAFSNQTSWVLP